MAGKQSLRERWGKSKKAEDDEEEKQGGEDDLRERRRSKSRERKRSRTKRSRSRGERRRSRERRSRSRDRRRSRSRERRNSRGRRRSGSSASPSRSKKVNIYMLVFLGRERHFVMNLICPWKGWCLGSSDPKGEREKGEGEECCRGNEWNQDPVEGRDDGKHISETGRVQEENGLPNARR